MNTTLTKSVLLPCQEGAPRDAYAALNLDVAHLRFGKVTQTSLVGRDSAARRARCWGVSEL
jgi:hypothetical protein